MSLTTLGIITLCLSAAAVIAALILSVVLYVKNRKDDDHHILSPLRLFTICFFLAVVIALFPVNYTVVDEVGFWSVLKTILISAQNALQVFTVNAGFDSVQSVMGSSNINELLSKAYTVYTAVLFIVAPAITAGFILSLFKETSERIKYSLHFKSNVYVISELNEKSLTLAEDIYSKAKGKKVIVFAGVKREDGNSDLIDRAKKLGAICFKRDITKISLKPMSSSISRRVYFISEQEDKNISLALNVINNIKKKANLNSERTKLFVFAHSFESETLLNSIDVGKMKVRRINDNKNLAWQTLQKISIFKDAESANNEMNIVIVGCGQYGTELLKAICWLGQMPYYSLRLHIFDKEANLENIIKNIAPELVLRSGISQPGEANYSIYFYPKTDVDSAEFVNMLNGLGKVTSVFVTLGSDEINIDTALKMRIAFLRDRKYNKTQPAIYPVVYNKLRNEMADSGKNLKIAGKVDGEDKEHSYNLQFIGSIEDCYSIENIEQESLENSAREYHLIWANTAKDKEEAIKKFNKYEYYRASSMAQAIYINYLKNLEPIKKEIFDSKNIWLFNEYEHRRWNTYMRAEGYVYSNVRNDLAKNHPDLKSFYDLSEKEKQKDTVWKIALGK